MSSLLCHFFKDLGLHSCSSDTHTAQLNSVHLCNFSPSWEVSPPSIAGLHPPRPSLSLALSLWIPFPTCEPEATYCGRRRWYCRVYGALWVTAELASLPRAPDDCFIPPESELGIHHVSPKPSFCFCLRMSDAVAVWEHLSRKESSGIWPCCVCGWACVLPSEGWPSIRRRRTSIPVFLPGLHWLPLPVA